MEPLRVIPPVPMTIRKAKTGDWMEGMYLPKGTLLYIPVRPTSTRSQNFEDNTILSTDSCRKYLVKDLGR